MRRQSRAFGLLIVGAGVVFVLVFLGLVGAIGTTSTPLRDMDGELRSAANGFSKDMANGSVDEEMVVRTVAQRHLSTGEVVDFATPCLNWEFAEILAIRTPITPFHAEVTFSDGESEVVLQFSYEDHPGSSVPTDIWYVVLNAPSC